ncbi:hypothetical protein EV189_1060 [Motilibacter rhizosphaerae]|uniref:3-methyladenine DNA glycosylase n=1 Tax=Motilibacter rhizosphaerae TaxID=598652 RepID=A0A4Q7NXZ4_9ACTN|nr:3-methyladenine DNA glycosylase [Motilibacter rhizosphaerae]RZS91808.1 hypothetical protein EV189_1060 [Motilibacter rhizosphaerae]
MKPTTLPESEWRARRAAHEARVDAWLAPAEERARRGEKHPVEDFLFTYYSFRRSALRRWTPGAGVALEGATTGDLPSGIPDAAGHLRLPDPPERVRRTAAWVADLLQRTASRPGTFSCFGLHEWAMVHGSGPDEVRHAAVPLRLGARGTDQVVAELPLQCSHFDAFRFFTESARPLNSVQPSRESQGDLEQPGCLHANMDLYKWSYKLAPWTPSELVADCFALAREVRELDMRASPYDLADLGYAPVRIETAAGRAEYAAAQRRFAAAAAPLRQRLAEAALVIGAPPADA